MTEGTGLKKGVWEDLGRSGLPGWPSFAFPSDLQSGRAQGTARRADQSTRTRLILGFDGVICADAEEVAVAACQAAFNLWPDAMSNADDISLNEAGVRQSWVDYEWERLLEHRSSAVFTDAPPWLLYKLQKLRPACQAGWEMVLLARLCVEEAVACRANRAKGRGGARPLTIGETCKNLSMLFSGASFGPRLQKPSMRSVKV